ncbi:MAG TPA: mechanosensitive ion channel domain-containing protein [Steroidobacteraceae bacterium]|jgi:small-conductance mechanosensitive channel|nr:mechanosensitive ion channel domain-containing protein [Steroidobacteraceae bacterium]
MPNLDQFWKQALLWNSVGAWIIALGVFLIVFVGLLAVRGIFKARRRKWRAAGRALPVALDLTAQLIEKTTRLFIWGVALYCAIEQLDFPSTSHLAHRIDRGVDILITLIFWYQVARWATATLRYSIDQRRRSSGDHGAAIAGSMEIILFVAGVLIWALALLLALDNMGVAIRPLLAGLGIGGIAVALAVQAVLGDLLASMSIAMDKPFVIGDLLSVDTLTGTVEYIGVKSTRIRSITGEQIVVANADITKSRIRNFGRMRERRVSFEIPLAHDTAVAVLRGLPDAVRALIEESPRARFLRCSLLTLTETALRYEVVYFVRAPEMAAYAEVQHGIMIALLAKFRELGVQFPTPAQVPMPTKAALPAATPAQ